MTSDTLTINEQTVIEPHPYPEAVGMSDGCVPAGVKATHRPTGMVVIVTHHSSREQNVESAMRAIEIGTFNGRIFQCPPFPSKRTMKIESRSDGDGFDIRFGPEHILNRDAAKDFKYSDDEFGGTN